MKALVTGANGQDGSYMVDHLLEEGYEVHGIVRPSGNQSLWRLDPAQRRLQILTVRSDHSCACILHGLLVLYSIRTSRFRL